MICSEGGDEFVYLLLRHMLHDHHVSQFTAKTPVITQCQQIFVANLLRRALEEYRITILIIPAWPPYLIQLLLEVSGALHHLISLFRPLVIAHLPDQPPELKRLYRIARAVDHLHVGVEISDIEVILVVIGLTGAEEETGGRIDAEELMSADSDSIEPHLLMAHQILVFRKRQVPAKERGIHMAIDRHLGMAVEHGVECVLIINRPLKVEPIA